MDDIYKHIEEYNLIKKRKVLIAFHNIIADMVNDKELSFIVTELFIRGRKLNILLIYTLLYYANSK